MIKQYVQATLITIIFLSASGCGYKTYVDRERATAQHYKYIEKLDNALQKIPFGNGPSTRKNPRKMTFRVPKNFIQIQSGMKKEGDLDKRQPDYLDDYELPGLVAAWEMPINVSDQQMQSRVYLYALSNYDLYEKLGDERDRERNAPKPTDFVRNLKNDLVQVLRINKTPESRTISVPGRTEKEFAPENTFEEFTFTPERKIRGNQTKFELIVFNAGDIQAALLLVSPNGIAQEAEIRKRLTLALHTFDAFKPGAAQPSANGVQPKPTGGGPGF